MRAVISYSLSRRPTSEDALDEVEAGGAGIERRLFEEVVGGGFIEQRLDVAFEARRCRRRNRRETRSADAGAAPAPRETAVRRPANAEDSSDAACVRADGSVPGSPRVAATGLEFNDAERPPFQGINATRPCDSGYPMSAIGVRNPFFVSTT